MSIEDVMKKFDEHNDIYDAGYNEGYIEGLIGRVNKGANDRIDSKLDYEQQYKADAGKPKLTLIPHEILYDIATVREYGNNKYPDGGPDNWKNVSIERYRDAAFRHFLLYLADPKGVDDESGIPHLSHLACNIAFLCELEKEEEA